MKILLAIASLILLAVFTEVGLGLETSSLRQEMDNVFPHIVEYINNFSINTNDLENTLNNQLHDIKLGDIKTSYAHIINSTVSLSHYGSEKRLEYLTPLKVKIINDTFTVFVMFNIHVLHIVGGKNYTCNTSIPLIYVNYTKEVDLNNGHSLISSLSSTYSSQSFSQAVCKESESSKDKTRIDEAVSSTQGSSIFIQLKKNFDRMQEFFTTNAKDQHLSNIYDKNPYEYDYYGFKINVNVSTIQASKFGLNVIQNGISGNIAGTTKAAVAPPPYEEGYTSFYSIQFIQNLIAYSSVNYPAWKNIKLNGKNMRNRVFKYRLIDLQYIVPSVLRKYPKNYMNDVEFTCGVQSIRELVIDTENVTQSIDWRCTGSFEIQPTKRETFLNFVVSAKHILSMRADEEYLVVFVNELQVKTFNFDVIGDYEVVDPALFAFFVDEGLFEFRLYTIGTYFKIYSPNKAIKLVPGKGIWFG